MSLKGRVRVGIGVDAVDEGSGVRRYPGSLKVDGEDDGGRSVRSGERVSRFPTRGCGSFERSISGGASQGRGELVTS